MPFGRLRAGRSKHAVSTDRRTTEQPGIRTRGTHSCMRDATHRTTFLQLIGLLGAIPA
jgi:hypothetical protein